jgi:hypothetical protein
MVFICGASVVVAVVFAVYDVVDVVYPLTSVAQIVDVG